MFTDMDCPICFNQIQASQMVITSCNHHFCQQCLQEWLFNHNTCPICRLNIETSLLFENSNDINDLNMEENNLNINNQDINDHLNQYINDHLHLNLNDTHIINQIINNLRNCLMMNDLEEFENMLIFIYEHNLINTVEILNNLNNINNININSFFSLVHSYDRIYNH